MYHVIIQHTQMCHTKKLKRKYIIKCRLFVWGRSGPISSDQTQFMKYVVTALVPTKYEYLPTKSNFRLKVYKIAV
jgi:hypothetical protein